MYDSVSSGWKFEFCSLRHYLTRHLGRSRACEWLPCPSPLPMAEAWRTLSREGALVREGSLAGHREGDPYRFIGPDGKSYTGTDLRSISDKGFAGTVSELDDAILRIQVERDGAASSPCFWPSIWRRRGEEAPASARVWHAAIACLVA